MLDGVYLRREYCLDVGKGLACNYIGAGSDSAGRVSRGAGQVFRGVRVDGYTGGRSDDYKQQTQQQLPAC